eukprot:6200830-Pleurochrysis_carterae.AAC.3
MQCFEFLLQKCSSAFQYKAAASTRDKQTRLIAIDRLIDTHDQYWQANRPGQLAYMTRERLCCTSESAPSSYVKLQSRRPREIQKRRNKAEALACVAVCMGWHAMRALSQIAEMRSAECR